MPTNCCKCQSKRCNYRNNRDKYNICVAFLCHRHHLRLTSICCPPTQPLTRLYRTGIGTDTPNSYHTWQPLGEVCVPNTVRTRKEDEKETGTGTGVNKDRNLTLHHGAVNSHRVEEDWLPPSNCLPLTGWQSGKCTGMRVLRLNGIRIERVIPQLRPWQSRHQHEIPAVICKQHLSLRFSLWFSVSICGQNFK